MALQTWLADELRAAGLKVVEVSGWKTRGSKLDDGTYRRFDPIGVTWHATAGSRTSTADGEVNVLLNGSTSAPPPIAQLMIYRDGTVYVVAAGRCNHNLIGWGGPNKGLGNGDLFGIEMANDNRGEPWPAVQLAAARTATVVLFRHIGTSPLKRLAAHYEHQPYPAPDGQTSTKSDPYGVRMTDERPRVAAMMEEDPVTPEDITAIGKAAARETWAYLIASPSLDVAAKPAYDWAKDAEQVSRELAAAVTKLVASIQAAGAADEDELRAILERLTTLPGQTADAVTAALGAQASPEEKAELLRAALGDDATEVGRLLAEPTA